MLGIVWALAAQFAPAPAAPLPRVEVTASARDDGRAPRAASEDVIDADTLERAGPHVDLSEALARVPGVFANNRWNFAQDTQLSVRGYGARSSFGVRGVRLYVNGIPATAPDGQGQLGHVMLDGVDRISVLRGPLATLYGNAAAAVIRVETDELGAPRQLRAETSLTDFAQTYGAGWRSGEGVLNAQGFRAHSAARRTNLDAGAQGAWGVWQWSGALSLSDTPEAEDPLGLTREQFAIDPRGTASAATQFDTRKAIAQQQLGFSLRREAESARPGLSVATYAGHRDIEQYLSLAPAAQRNPLSGGGVVDLGRDYGGVEARGWQRWRTASGEWGLDLGLNFDTLDEARRGYENFIGNQLGVRGALRRNETNRVRNLDALISGHWRPNQYWRVVGGVRDSRLKFESRDHYITAANPDDSGRRDIDASNPAFAVFFTPRPKVALHAAISRATETPTVNELAYREDGASGFNKQLRATRALRRELGAQWRLPRGRVSAAWFDDNARNDIVVARSQGGRTSFRNERHTTRRGLEAQVDLTLSPHWRAHLNWTQLTARAASGRRLPGVPARFGAAELLWSPREAWTFGWQARYADSVPVEDGNTIFAPAYVTQNLLAAYTRAFEGGDSRWSLRVDNLFDKTYAASVIVNEAQGRYFEPAPGRSYWLNAQWRWR